MNGKHVGAKLWPPHKFQTDAFRAGTNEIRIRAGNLVNNNYGMAAPSGLPSAVLCEVPALQLNRILNTEYRPASGPAA